MNKYVKLGIAVVAFVGFMAGIYVLYQSLSEDYKPQQNIVVENNADSTISEAADTGKQDADIVQESVSDSTNQSDASTEQNADTQEKNPENTQTTMAVDFTMTNAAGEEVNLLDFKGKPIVLNFWASWCGPCKAELPDFQTAYEKYGENVEFILLNMTDGQQETVDTAQKFIAKEGYTLPFYFDTVQMQGAYTYGVSAIPTTFFISAEGEMIAYASGMLDAETLEYGISMIYTETR